MTPEERRALAQSISQGQMTHKPAPEPQGGPRERGRAIAQGLTFGGADEAEAFLRSLAGEDYDTALADVRSALKAYKDARPGESLSFEIGGAALPTIVAAVASGGASTAATLPFLAKTGRLLGVGAMEGGTYAFNAGEGGLKARASGVPDGAVLGAAGSAAGAGLAAAGGASLRGLADFARRKFGPRASSVVERQVKKAAEDAGISIDDAVQGVMEGRLLADNRTIASVARGWRAQSAEADEVISDVYTVRPQTLRSEVTDFLRKNMAGDGDPNVLRAQQASSQAMKDAASDEYNRVFDAMPEAPESVQQGVARAFARVPDAAAPVQKMYRAGSGDAPFFSADEAGNILFKRNASLREAETIRRGVNDAASTAYRSGSGGVGEAYSAVERDLRGLLDEASKPLKDVRAKWAAVESQGEAFDAGRKALSKSADEVEIEFDKMRSKGPAEVAAYRSGLFSAYNARAATGSGKSLPRNIVNEERKEGQILRLVFPEDGLDTLLGKASRAADAQDASNIMLGGSPTSITDGRIREQAFTAAQEGMNAAAGDTRAMLSLANMAVKTLLPGMTPKQAAEAARLVVESNPDVVARALSDKGAMNQLYKIIEGATRGGTTIAGDAAGATGGLLSSF